MKIGLSGSRYSGKDTVCKIMKDFKIPVFEADVVLNFIINYDMQVNNAIMKELPSLFSKGYLQPNKIQFNYEIDLIIKCAESKLFQSFVRFCDENTKPIIKIFHSSILYERGWDSIMDKNITVFTPKQLRLYRCREVDKMSHMESIDYLIDEPDEFIKNKKGDFVIHSYYDTDVKQQSKDILNRLLEIYFNTKLVDKKRAEELMKKYLIS
jgi:dephospho-CoA kinase